ncbi:ABC transporter permease subunit [Halocatena pleomorpha]|uniref:ABC transporter permease n=1 Tax=Halocatena pleomorpha TaxID=1785090 RepID=A0A3P3RES9_9EURY|nr:ABC transporter permease subunit [Halocatena pleomorpha]RRJ31844.1 ABC transporter permease [Halocatena pleomorpha]
MSTLVIAKKEFEDAIRARTLQLLVAFFVGFTTLVFHYHRSRLGEDPTFTTLFDGIVGMLGVVVPVLGVMVGYNAIVAERESGSLTLLLTLPHSRLDIMLGKFLGRSAIVVVTVAVGFILIGIQTILFTDLFSLTEFLLAAGEITLFGILFVAIAIAFSTAMRTSMTASIGALGLTILFSFLWDFVTGLIVQFVHPIPATGSRITRTPAPNWTTLFQRLNPRRAFMEIGFVREPIPFYLDPWFGWVIVGFWLVVPLGLAYLRFQNSDLA